jgi:hypothetical protein
VLPHGASSKEKALWAIHPCSAERGILAFSRKKSICCVALHLSSLQRTSMYASFLNLPVAGRHSRALHLELFTVPSTLPTLQRHQDLDRKKGWVT